MCGDGLGIQNVTTLFKPVVCGASKNIRVFASNSLENFQTVNGMRLWMPSATFLLAYSKIFYSYIASN